MSRFRCQDCGCIATSYAEMQQHRVRAHPGSKSAADLERDAIDQWVMIRACAKDQQWLWLVLALDQHVRTIQQWMAAVERRL